MARGILGGLLCTLFGCGASSERLECHPCQSELLEREMAFALLRPPPGDLPDDQLPVVYFLHGLGDDHRAMDKFGLSDRLYAAMEEGRVPRAHVVLPKGGRGFWIDWYDGRHPYESYVLEEVLPAAEEILGFCVDPARRHVAGVSMGGIGAVHIGLRHPELFASITSLSGPILDEQQAVDHVKKSKMRFFVDLEAIFSDGSDRGFFEAHNPYIIVRRRGPDLGQRLFIAAGSGEKPFFRDTTAAFHTFLEEQGVEHRYVRYEGGHGWRFWAPLIEQAFDYVFE